MSKKVIALIAVRMKSSRLPAKATIDLSGAPLILRLHNRLIKSKRIDGIVWCTSTNKQDDALQELAELNGISVYRGSELDVIDRFLKASKEHNPDIIIRVTGDNPLTDPEMMDYMIERHIDSEADFTFTEDLPTGTSPEVISMPALNRCHKLVQDPSSSEYLTLMLMRPSHFRLQRVSVLDRKLKRPEMRLTVDTPEDLEVIRHVYEAFSGNPPELFKIINWLDDNPKVRDINKNIIVEPLNSTVNVLLKGD